MLLCVCVCEIKTPKIILLKQKVLFAVKNKYKLKTHPYVCLYAPHELNRTIWRILKVKNANKKICEKKNFKKNSGDRGKKSTVYVWISAIGWYVFNVESSPYRHRVCYFVNRKLDCLLNMAAVAAAADHGQYLQYILLKLIFNTKKKFYPTLGH